MRYVDKSNRSEGGRNWARKWGRYSKRFDTRARVCGLRKQHAIAAYREGERAEREEITLDEAAAALKVSPSTVRRLIEEQSLPAQQLCKGAPWVIKAYDLERPEVKRAAQARRFRRPASGDPRQKELEL
jgi:excisionase family DNA binding protein